MNKGIRDGNVHLRPSAKQQSPTVHHLNCRGLALLKFVFTKNLFIDFFKCIGTASVEAVGADLTFRQAYRLDKCGYTVLIR